VLVIDDDEAYRYLLRQQFKNLPVVVSEASNGAEGVRLACKLKPRVICLDLAMPEMNGFEALRRLKAEPAVRGIPVIVVTSQILSNAERAELLASSAGIMQKEILGHRDVADMVRRVLSEQGPREVAI